MRRAEMGVTDMAATEAEVLAGVIEVVRKQLALEPERRLGPETHLRNDLGTDSLFEAEIAMELEERFGLNMPDDFHPTTIQEIVQAIGERLPK